MNRLPIGTVVMLKGGKKRIMVAGFLCQDAADRTVTYDYCALLYPEGYIKPNELLMFNHDQIEKIYYLGLNDSENKEFQQKLDEYMNTQKN